MVGYWDAIKVSNQVGFHPKLNQAKPILRIASMVILLVFMVLKLTALITWSLLWVFSPIWILLLIGAIIVPHLNIWLYSRYPIDKKDLFIRLVDRAIVFLSPSQPVYPSEETDVLISEAIGKACKEIHFTPDVVMSADLFYGVKEKLGYV